MIAMTVLYPKAEGTTFDLDYFATKHMPLFAARLGDACQGMGVIAAAGDDYHAIGWTMITSQEALNATLAEHGAEIMGDIANYTNTTPTAVVGETVDVPL
jgi:uncharacterized protein (TIGR02118 family)